MNRKNIYFIASVKEERIEAINEVAKKLEDLGCRINHIHSFSGIITGEAAAGTSLQDLKTEDISHIEPDREIKTRQKKA